MDIVVHPSRDLVNITLTRSELAVALAGFAIYSSLIGPNKFEGHPACDEEHPDYQMTRDLFTRGSQAFKEMKDGD